MTFGSAAQMRPSWRACKSIQSVTIVFVSCAVVSSDASGALPRTPLDLEPHLPSINSPGAHVMRRQPGESNMGERRVHTRENRQHNAGLAVHFGTAKAMAVEIGSQ